MTGPPTLRLTALLAPCADRLIERLAPRLETRLGRPIERDLDPDWRRREQRLREGGSVLATVCGGYLIRTETRDPGALEPLVAPVLEGARYAGRPVYHSDVIVAREAPWQSWAELEGKRLAFNETGSHSGYDLVRNELARTGATARWFGEWIETGSHHAAVEAVRSGTADVAAIDGTILDDWRASDPDRMRGLRVVHVLGPSPAPVLVATREVPREWRDRVIEALTTLEPEAEGAIDLRPVRRFVRVGLEDYEPIRRMQEAADALPD